jgi:hypothetical protein
VALLADLIHNVGDALTAVPVGVAFLLRSERAERWAGSRLLFEHTPTDAEIDFVGPGLEAAFEAKYVDTKWKREAQTMRARYSKGILATRGALETDGDIWAVPAAALLS